MSWGKYCGGAAALIKTKSSRAKESINAATIEVRIFGGERWTHVISQKPGNDFASKCHLSCLIDEIFGKKVTNFLIFFRRVKNAILYHGCPLIGWCGTRVKISIFPMAL